MGLPSLGRSEPGGSMGVRGQSKITKRRGLSHFYPKARSFATFEDLLSCEHHGIATLALAKRPRLQPASADEAAPPQRYALQGCPALQGWAPQPELPAAPASGPPGGADRACARDSWSSRRSTDDLCERLMRDTRLGDAAMALGTAGEAVG